MSLINFTVTYDQLIAQADGADDNTDLDIVGLVGDVHFDPMLSSERPILAPAYTPRPAGFKLTRVTGYLDSDGRLRASRGGALGVRLWANDPVFNLDNLAYRVIFDLTTPMGQAVRLDGGFFSAPRDDRTLNLASELQSAGSFGGPRIAGGSFVDSTVIFENSDASFVEAIEIPNGTLVFVDNGDGTWSVG